MAKAFIERGYKIVSGGTENHLLLRRPDRQGITGKDAEAALGRAHITVNKNAVPNDPQKPFVTSGMRIGTPAITTRGFTEADASLTANSICDVLDDIGNEHVQARVREEVSRLCARYPVYAGV